MERNTEKAIEELGDKIDSLAKGYALCFLAEHPNKTDAEAVSFITNRTEQMKEDLIRTMTAFVWRTEEGTFDSIEHFGAVVEKAKELMIEQIMVQISEISE